MGDTMESLVKITKECLMAVLKDCLVTEKTLHTFFVEIESNVNNRLSNPLTNDPNDTKSLKANHFLVARASPNQRFIATAEKDINLSSKSKAIQTMKDIFWKKWIKEYLPGLTKKQIQMSYLQDIKVGNLVIIAEGNIEILK